MIPYFGYARQDRKVGPRTPISAKLVANLITEAGADRVLTVDLHAGQIQGFFDIPTDNLYAMPVIVKDIQDYLGGENLMVVSPDVGGVVRARALAKRLGADLAIVDKRRERAGESEVMNIIGDVEGRVCLLVDDIVDSGGTICNAAEALIEQGAEGRSTPMRRMACCRAALWRASRIRSSNRWWSTDSIAATEEVRKCPNIRRISIAPLIGEAHAPDQQRRERFEPVRLRRNHLPSCTVRPRCHSQADEITVSISFHLEANPSTRCAAEGSATSIGGSPLRRAAIRVGGWRPVTRATESKISRTEWPRPVPRLSDAVWPPSSR